MRVVPQIDFVLRVYFVYQVYKAEYVLASVIRRNAQLRLVKPQSVHGAQQHFLFIALAVAVDVGKTAELLTQFVNANQIGFLVSA